MTSSKSRNDKPKSVISGSGRLLRKPAVLIPVVCVIGLGIFGVYSVRTRPMRLAHGESSPKAVAARLVGALAANDLQALKDLAISKEEFQAYVWPELPASNPRTNIPFDYVWNDVFFRSMNRMGRTYKHFQGHRIEVVKLGTRKNPETFATHTAWPGYEMTIRVDGGPEEELPLFGTLIEMDGVFKVYSYAPYD